MRNWRQAADAQAKRNQDLLDDSRYMKPSVTSQVLDFSLDLRAAANLSDDQAHLLTALEKDAARIALRSLASLAEIGELEHLGGGLELIPALNLTMAVADNEAVAYTIEHAHTSVGYFSVLAAWGYLDPEMVVTRFRRGLDITGHVSWVPGGTQLSGGRLGVMIPVAVGQALGLRAHRGDDALVICHCGDAGWVSGQALNGFMGADLHGAPIVFVMNRNGIQLSNTTQKIVDKDPRRIVSALGVEVMEIPTLHDSAALMKAYSAAADRARSGKPCLIYPTGIRSDSSGKVTLATFGEQYGVAAEVEAFAAENDVPTDHEVWVPGSLMSFRDVGPMLECLFFVNDLPGGAGHHDGSMKGRELDAVLANPMLAVVEAETKALEAAASKRRASVTEARPEPGSPNLALTDDQVRDVSLPGAGEKVSARGGTQAAYAAVAEAYPDKVFTVSCDLDPSTKLDKAKTFLSARHTFEMGIMEQASSLMADGLAMSSHEPQLVVFSTFAAFFEGIAREGLELWRYQRNLTGANEGLNVTMHLSHVGACTGRDHFSGWSLDWVTLAMGYLPYLHRFYTPADARAAFVAVRDLAGHYGAHIIGVPRDNLPILTTEGGEPVFETTSTWEPVTALRTRDGAKRAILALGAPAYLAAEASDALAGDKTAVDAYVVNGLPIGQEALQELLKRYPEGVVTVEDGLIGDVAAGIRGFASLVQSAAAVAGTPAAHVGIVDPRIAPSEGHLETWEHFGITADAIKEAVDSLG